MRNNTFEIHVIGIDSSGLEGLTLSNKNIVSSATRIAAPKRVLNSFEDWWKKENIDGCIPETISTEKIKLLIAWIRNKPGKIIILASGDPLWFGIGRILIKNFSTDLLHFYPSPTSLQLAFAKLKIPWQNTKWISLHGRDPIPLAYLLQKRPDSLAVLTDPQRGGAKEVRDFLKSSGLEQTYAFWIFENLGNDKEKIYKLSPNDALPSKLNPLHMVLLIHEVQILKNKKEIPLIGIDDGFFITHKDCPGLITKREIRIQLIADLELPDKGVIWDIGSGAGTIGLESLRLRPNLKLVSIEKRIGSQSIIKENASRLDVNPERIYESEAIEIIDENNSKLRLENPDRVILSGGGKDKVELLKIILKRINPNGIIVIPMVTLQNFSKLEQVLKSYKCELKVSQIQVNRGIPIAEGTRFAPINPIFILRGQLKKRY